MHLEDTAKSVTDSGHHGKSEKAVPKEIGEKWGVLVYKLYQRMVDTSDVSFFISSPQVILTLGFLFGVAEEENTMGMKLAFYNMTKAEIEEEERKNEKDGSQIDFLINNTLKFVHNWSNDIHSTLMQYHRVSRVIAHPKFVWPHNFRTFRYFRAFGVQEKVFENYEEIQEWASASLKAEFPPWQRIVSVWPSEFNEADFAEQKKIEKAAIESSRKGGPPVPGGKGGSSVGGTGGGLGGLPGVQLSWKPRKDPRESEKRAPILLWASHSIVEMSSEHFDGEFIYTWSGREYLKINGSPRRQIHVKPGLFDFTSIILPTKHQNLVMIVIYEMDRYLCNLDQLQEIVINSYLKMPCILRKRGKEKEASKNSIFLPHWKPKDFPAIQLAHHLAATIDMTKVFYPGGFGNLASPDAIPSASGDVKKIGHIQHFGLVSFAHAADNKKKMEEEDGEDGPLHQPLTAGSKENVVEEKPTKKEKSKEKSKKSKKKREKMKAMKVPINEPNAKTIEIVPFPFCLILWDCCKDMPVIMGKITGETTVEEKLELGKTVQEKKKNWPWS